MHDTTRACCLVFLKLVIVVEIVSVRPRGGDRRELSRWRDVTSDHVTPEIFSWVIQSAGTAFCPVPKPNRLGRRMIWCAIDSIIYMLLLNKYKYYIYINNPIKICYLVIRLQCAFQWSPSYLVKPSRMAMTYSLSQKS